jgi:hypothetical protein
MYLGNLIEASGKFHSTHIELSKKGSKVMFSMFKYLNPIGVSGSLLGVYLGLFSLPGNMEVYGSLPPGPSGSPLLGRIVLFPSLPRTPLLWMLLGVSCSLP